MAPKGSRVGWMRGCLFILLLGLPQVCFGQAAAAPASFGNLPRSVKPGQVVIVTDKAGSQKRGKVSEVSDSALVILTKDQRGQWSVRETVTPPDVREIKRTGPIWDKALVGFGIGALVGALGADDCTGCTGASGLAMGIGGIGAGIGFGFDAAFGPKRVYSAPRSQESALVITPFVGRARGVNLAFRF